MDRMENCCDSALKYLTFILNFFLFLTGVALIALGAYCQVVMGDYVNFVDSSYVNSAIAFIVIGVVILVVGFFGCCGACTENHCMMYTYSILLTVIILVEIGAAIAIYIYKGRVSEEVSNKMIEGLEHYTVDESSEFIGMSQTWDIAQADFKCCGVTNYTNWKTSDYFEKMDAVPDQCCKTITDGCGKGKLSMSYEDAAKEINVDGCFTVLEKSIEDNIGAVGGVAVGIIVLQIVGVLIACMLAGNMRRRYNYV